MMKSRMPLWGKVLLTGAAASGALLLAACSGGPAGAGGAAGSGGSNAVAELEPLKIAMITHSAPGNSFWDIVRSGGEVAAERNNIELLYTSDPEGSRQAQLVDQAIDQGVDGIIVTLAKPDAMQDSVEKAIEAGIPVFSINSGEDRYAEMGVLAHFGQEEFIAGQAVGEQLNAEGKKKAICVIHEQGHVGLEARCEGLADTFEGSSEILYVNGQDMTNVASTTTSKLQTTKDIDVVVSLGAPFALATIDSIKDSGSDAAVVVTDLDPEVYNALGEGTILFAVDQQPWLQGYQSVEAVRLYDEGGYVLGGGKPALTGPTIITQENLDSVAKQFAGGADGAEAE